MCTPYMQHYFPAIRKDFICNAQNSMSMQYFSADELHLTTGEIPEMEKPQKPHWSLASLCELSCIIITFVLVCYSEANASQRLPDRILPQNREGHRSTTGVHLTLPGLAISQYPQYCSGRSYNYTVAVYEWDPPFNLTEVF